MATRGSRRLAEEGRLLLGLFAIASLLLAPAAGGGARAAASAQLQNVTFMLDTNFLPKHGIFFAAQGGGFYKQEGLNVNFLPSSGSYDASVAVGAGKAEFGFADFDTMVKARLAGSNVEQLATIHAISPFSVITLPKYHIHSFKDLIGKSIAGEPAGSNTIMWPVARKLCGLPPHAVKIISVDPRAKTPGLLAGKWPAIFAYSVSDPATLIGMGYDPVVLKWSDCGFEGYSNGLITATKTIQRDPDLVRRFVKATLEGVKWACNDQLAAAKNTQKFVHGMNLKAASAGIRLACGLLWTPEARQNGLGWFSEQGVKSTVDLAREFLGLKGHLDLSAFYTNRFNPHITPHTIVKAPKE